jgi:AraC-like DNA-binding protein
MANKGLLDFYKSTPEIEKIEYWNSFPYYHARTRVVQRTNITYFQQGCVEYFVDNKLLTAKSGDVIVLHKGQLCGVHKILSEPVACYAMLLEHDDYQGYSYDLPLPNLIHFGIHKELIHYFSKGTLTFMDRGKGYYFEGRAIGMLILSLLVRQIEPDHSDLNDNQKIIAIKDYINENYNRKISIKEIGEFIDLSPGYTGVFFKKNVGMSIQQYTNYVRIEKAKQLLIHSSLTISEIADECGFSDIYFFSKTFKKETGYSPSHYVKGDSTDYEETT